jgi:branched-chain amino acid transport system substrate-binding protein
MWNIGGLSRPACADTAMKGENPAVLPPSSGAAADAAASHYGVDLSNLGHGPMFAFTTVVRWARALRRSVAVIGLLLGAAPAVPGGAPVLVGVDAEFGLAGSTSAQAVELGMRIAIAEVNAAGGVLGGRPLQLVSRDNRSIPARALSNLRELAAMPDLVAVFGGKFSPVIQEAVPVVHELGLPLLAVWSSADPIVDNGRVPNYVFRLALRDSLGMPHMLTAAERRGVDRVGLLLANTGWGRSNLAAAERHVATQRRPAIVQVAWHNWGEKSLIQRYQSMRRAGAQAIVVVANDDDAALLVREMAALPQDERIPLIFHQGITGGSFAALAGPALQAVDLSVLQTFSFFEADAAAVDRFMAASVKAGGPPSIDKIEAPTGVAHAYDMLHLLAKAIDQAGSTDRATVRDALERLPGHRGLIKLYRSPFTATRHEALSADELLMARYRPDGVLVPADR